MTTAASCEACGWAAAFCSMLAFGSFGVPIKSPAATALDIDPLVFQSYKTFMCFITSWLVLTLPNSHFTYTPWGIVSGLFWVPGGVATVYAVKKAGLAIGIGIGSSFIVLVSFIWGIMIFEEKVHSRWGASFAILCMMMGLFGMSYFSSPEEASFASTASAAAAAAPVHAGSETETAAISTSGVRKVGEAAASPRQRSSVVAYAKVSRTDNNTQDSIDNFDNDDNDDDNDGLGKRPVSRKLQLTERTKQSCTLDEHNSAIAGEDGDVNDESDHFVDDDDDHHQDDASMSPSSSSSSHQAPHTIRMVHTSCCGIQLTERQCGMLAAVFCGTWGGSIMAPMKWCTSDTKGVAYLISFAIGSSIITILLWVLRFLYHYSKTQSWHAAYHELPSFHLRILWLAGGTCGLLWSIGNFFSLISVYYLGEGVGYPLVQTAILVSGLWGIFYFKEVQGTQRITKWFLSSLLTVYGILLLGYEHHQER
jgi:glucose uptake protein GlcU